MLSGSGSFLLILLHSAANSRSTGWSSLLAKFMILSANSSLSTSARDLLFLPVFGGFELVVSDTVSLSDCVHVISTSSKLPATATSLTACSVLLLSSSRHDGGPRFVTVL